MIQNKINQIGIVIIRKNHKTVAIVIKKACTAINIVIKQTG
jgi:hypothetical protein